MKSNTIWDKMQSIDPRILYIITLIVIAIPMIFPKINLPIVPSQESVDSFNAIEKMGASHKLILIDGAFSASSRGENGWQSQVIIEHLMRMRAPFAVMSIDPQNPQLMHDIIDKYAKRYGYVYGRDYVNFGYQVAFGQTVKGMVTNVKGTVKEDWKGTPLDKLSVLDNVHSMKDVGGIIDITPVSSLDTWLGLATRVYNTPLVYVPTAVMAPEGYPYKDSGQIQGILIGVKGAGDYEHMLGVKEEATQISTMLSMVYGLIIILIIFGNIGYHGARRAAAIAEKRDSE